MTDINEKVNDVLRKVFGHISEYVNRLMNAEELQTELIAYIQGAIILALPKAAVGNKKKPKGESSILSLMTVFCDVMGASRKEFLSSSVREASERWERYAVAMGYQKPIQTFSRYDDD